MALKESACGCSSIRRKWVMKCSAGIALYPYACTSKSGTRSSVSFVATP